MLRDDHRVNHTSPVCAPMVATHQHAGVNGTGVVEPGRGLRLPNGQFGALRTVADRPRSGIAPRPHQFHRDAQFASRTRASRCSRRSRSHSLFAASNRTKARMVPSPSRNHSPPCSSRTR